MDASHTGTPHFHNDLGVPEILLGSREFMCIGAKPPFDHPHVFLDMGATTRSSAPIARRSSATGRRSRAGASEPAACLWDDRSAAA